MSEAPIGSELFQKLIAPDDSFDGINPRVWAGTPWVIDVFTDRVQSDRRHAIRGWCRQHLGDPAFPFGGDPRPGRWFEGGATIDGWTWFGFATEADMRALEAAWPAPEVATAGDQP